MDYHKILENAFKGFDVVDPQILCAEIKFYPKEQLPQITIRIYYDSHAGRYFGSQSHYIKVPENATEYRSSHNFGDTIDEAMQHTIGSIMRDCTLAVRRGIHPDESWFVKNDSWS